eukprot:3573301-Rhodomonas_salina.1
MAAERGREAREEEKKSEERWIGAGVVGVHVRRGDKLLGIDGLHANYIQLDRFQDKATELVPHLKALYLATDDPSAASEAKSANNGALQEERGFQWLVDPAEQRLNGT